MASSAARPKVRLVTTFSRSWFTGRPMTSRTGPDLESPDIYNWPLFATNKGYHTLAIDRLGHGDRRSFQTRWRACSWRCTSRSSTNSLEISAAARHPLASVSARSSSAGHSYGSIIGVALAGRYPKDIDILIATAQSTTPYPPTLVALTDDLASARSTFPRLAGRPTGYLAVKHESVREAAFYTGGYDPALARLDYALSDAVTPGELLVQTPGLTPAVGFTGPVLVVTGAEDSVLCNPKTGLTCDEILNRTSALFPDSRSYGYYAPPNTGHDITLHFSAPKMFASVHQWLEGK